MAGAFKKKRWGYHPRHRKARCAGKLNKLIGGTLVLTDTELAYHPDLYDWFLPIPPIPMRQWVLPLADIEQMRIEQRPLAHADRHTRRRSMRLHFRGRDGSEDVFEVDDIKQNWRRADDLVWQLGTAIPVTGDPHDQPEPRWGV
jgi:hypothetical protein